MKHVCKIILSLLVPGWLISHVTSLTTSSFGQTYPLNVDVLDAPSPSSSGYSRTNGRRIRFIMATIAAQPQIPLPLHFLPSLASPYLEGNFR